MTDFMPTINVRTVLREFHQFYFDASARPKHAGEWRHIGDWNEEGKLVLHPVGSALTDAPWISVKDRLPTHNYSVLGVVVDGPFVVDDGSDDRMRDVVSYEPSRGWLQHDGNDSVVVTVTHWQDLPDLP